MSDIRDDKRTEEVKLRLTERELLDVSRLAAKRRDHESDHGIGWGAGTLPMRGTPKSSKRPGRMG